MSIQIKFRILIVDDAKENLVALNALLARDDIEIFKAKTGTEALDMLMDNKFNLALLDIQMPGMDGFELARYMRGTNLTKNIPIIFVSGEARDERIFFEGHALAPVDFIRKPLDPQILQIKVATFLK